MTGTDTVQHRPTDPAIYLRNMAALFRSDMSLAQRIDECEIDDQVRIEPARRGSLTVSVASNDGQYRYLHSRFDPAGEAQRFAEGVEIGKDFCYVVAGFGLGYHLLALAKRLTGDAFLVVTESNLALIKAALEHVDLTELLNPQRCVILTDPDKGQVQARLEPHSTLMMLGAKFVSHPPSEQTNGPFHNTMRKVIADHMTYWRMSLVTLVANSRITCRNVLNNLPRYLSTPPIDTLHNRFKNKPAVIVSAGPSLRRNIDQVVQLKGRAVLIAVQTTFKTLLDRGVPPDFVTSLDYHEMSRRFFEDVDCSRTHLIVEPKATWHVADAYSGPASFLDNRFARLCIGDSLAGRDGLKAGATVAHLALYLAAYLGCDPIILVGQDLAYTNHVYYTPGVAMHRLWRPQLNRFRTIEMMEWERIIRNRKILMKVKDVAGHNIYTDEQLFTYLQQFEGDFASMPGRVIDATEGGVLKAGTTVMPLADAARTYCREPIPPEKFDYLQTENWHDPSKLDAARTELEERLAEIDRVIEVCGQMTALLGELEGLLETPVDFNRRIAEVDTLRLRMQKEDRAYRMISGVVQHAELQRFRADRQLKLTEASGTELARGQLERDVRFVEAIAEGASILKEMISEGLERFASAGEKSPS